MRRTHHQPNLRFSADDGLWAYRDPLDRLFDLFFSPPDWPTAPNVVLQPFSVSVQQLVNPTVAKPKYFLSQGIDGTNLITVQASKVLGLVNAFVEAMRERVQQNQLETQYEAVLRRIVPDFDFQRILDGYGGVEVSITVLLDEKRAYVHFPIWTPTGPWSPDQAVEKFLTLATFHYQATTDPSYLHTILNDPNNTFPPPSYYDTDSSGNLVLHPGPVTDPITFPGPPNATVPLVYMGDTQSPLEACEMLVARYEAGEITYEEAYCKDYATPVPAQ